MELTKFNFRFVQNPNADRSAPYADPQRRVLSDEAFGEAKAEITSWPGYAPTPLVPLPGLAARLGIGAVHYKDEGERFGLKSFKALGGAYAVLRLIQGHLESKHGIAGVTAADLIKGEYRNQVADIVVAAATDGNHGRSVAWGAQMFGCRCVIYLHAHVSESREREIAKYGAEIRRVDGNYQDSVSQCAQDGRANGWFVVGDTTEGRDWAVPSMVMQGYMLLIDEALEQMPSKVRPSHVFVQGGVGGLAAAVIGYLWERWGGQRPRVVIIEPMRADCIYRSIAAGERTRVPGDFETFMACLAAAEVSPPAWEILKTGADDVVELPDASAAETMRILATGVDGDQPLVAGESGCAATAGLIAVALDDRARTRFGLDTRSVVLVVGSEGATDAETFARIVGEDAETVLRRAALRTG